MITFLEKASFIDGVMRPRPFTSEKEESEK